MLIQHFILQVGFEVSASSKEAEKQEGEEMEGSASKTSERSIEESKEAGSSEAAEESISKNQSDQMDKPGDDSNSGS